MKKTSKTSREEWFLSSEFIESSPGALLDQEPPSPVRSHDSASSPLKSAERYQKIALIGEGGMGRVWLGWDATIERNVAIKEPNKSASICLLDKLQREVLITAKLDHPGIVAVHDIVHDDAARPLFVMALIRGQTLATHLAESAEQGIDARPHRERLLRHLLSVCEIIGHAHQRGVLHRDLTPRNIIIEESGTTRVIDWGLAVTFDEARRGPIAAGTPGFMSPEQERGAPLDARSDVWALGALLYTILFGRAPLPHTRTPVKEHHTALEAICAKAMQEALEDRYTDAAAMAHDLLCWFEGRRVDAFEMSPWQMTRWLLARYTRQIVLTALLLFSVSGALGVSALFALAEADRAHDAEQVARAQRTRADLASALATHEAREAREASERLYLRMARRALSTGDILEAEKMLEQAESIAHSSRTVGMRMQLGLIPKLKLRHERTLTFCPGTSLLTPDPMLQLCWLDDNRFEAWSGQQRLWVADLAPELLALNPYNHLEDWRLDAHRLVVRGSLQGALEVNLKNGEVRVLTDKLVRFASIQDTDPIDLEQLRWLDDTQEPSCHERLIHAYRFEQGTSLFLCHDGEVWRREPGQPDALIYKGDRSSPHHHLYVGPRKEHWFASSDGTIWPLDHFERHIKLGAPVKRIFPIPGTTFIAAQAWGGSWRILETIQGDWIASFDTDVEDVRASHGTLQVLRDGKLSIWSMPYTQIMRRYKGMHGFTDIAWARDGESIGATSGGSLVHHIYPFEDRYTPPTIFGRDVMKSLTPWKDEGFLAVGAMIEQSALKGLIVFKDEGNLLSTSQLDPYAKTHVVGRRLETLSDDTILVISIAKSFYYVRYNEQTERFEATALSKKGPFLDADTDASRHRALVVGTNVLRFPTSLGFDQDDLPSPPHARYGSINEDGRFALITRDELLIYSAQGKIVERVEVERPTSIEWRSGHEHIFTGHLDGSVRVWHATRGELLAEMTPHEGLVSSIDISPDDSIVATASWDTTVRLMSLHALDDAAARDF